MALYTKACAPRQFRVERLGGLLLLARLASCAGPETVAFDASRYAAVVRVSAAAGTDRPRAAVYRSIGYALSRIGDAGEARRYAVTVAAGTYGAVSLKSYVDLYGGFEPGGSRRDIHRFATVLEGGDKGRVLTCASNVQVDGFRIVHGRARGSGGALLCVGESPDITNNSFIDNRSLAPEAWTPKNLHEDANDGGAIACNGGCAARISGNLFYRNATEVGRGGGLAVNRAAPEVRGNVFLENTAGLADPARSSDGGAISIYDHARPVVEGNFIIANRALASNDGGGVFVALWSSPVIERNVLVGNYGDDDGGALFAGGQKHHYGTPIDAIPPAAEFMVRVRGNVIAGNTNRAGTAGAMRVTMNSRLLLEGNRIYQNPGGVNLQRSDVEVIGNTILDPTTYREKGTGVFARNILKGGLKLEQPATVTESACEAPVFTDEGGAAVAARATFDPAQALTELAVEGTPPPPGRPVRFGDRWTVVRSSAAGKVVVWGDTGERRSMEWMPAYSQSAGSPCGATGASQ